MVVLDGLILKQKGGDTRQITYLKPNISFKYRKDKCKFGNM
jgi:hypothetical protein